MAGDWIKMRSNLWDDPRIAALVEFTGTSEAAVVGALYWLWATADQHTEDGHLPGLTLGQIDRKTGVAGFGAALVRIGWMLEVSDGVMLSDFDQHNGQSAKRRCAEAQRKASVRNVSASHADKTRTKPGQKTPSCGAREEKRRDTPSKDGDGDAVAATRAELWTAGKSLLAEQGMPERQCGSFVGKLVKDYGDVVVVESVRAAVVARPADAAEYIKAACLHAVGKRSKQTESFAEQAAQVARARVNAFAPGIAAGGITTLEGETRVIAIHGR